MAGRTAEQSELCRVAAAAVRQVREVSLLGDLAVGRAKLDAGKIESLVKTLRAFPTANNELAQLLLTEAEYFARNAERMRYPKFRANQLFVGSGVIEAGFKTVIGSRMKQSGMFWTVRGANAIVALRCNRLSHRFDDYWESRAGRMSLTNMSRTQKQVGKNIRALRLKRLVAGIFSDLSV